MRASDANLPEIPGNSDPHGCRSASIECRCISPTGSPLADRVKEDAFLRSIEESALRFGKDEDGTSASRDVSRDRAGRDRVGYIRSLIPDPTSHQLTG